jgi:hypothetical protein
MDKRLVVVKLHDSVVVPVALTDANLFLGRDYHQAQYLRLHRPRLSLRASNLVVQEPSQSVCLAAGEQRFRAFLHQFRQAFGNRPLACLYALTDKISYLRQATTDLNILNYFAFATDDDSRPDVDARLPDVDHWWTEGPMLNLALLDNEGPVLTPTAAPTPPAADVPAENAYYTMLEAAAFPFKGKGIRIIESEDFGGPPGHLYLRHVPTTVVNASAPSSTLERHFYKSLGMVFAKPPVPMLPTHKPVYGLAPEASLQVFAFPAETGTWLSLFSAFQANFKQRWLLTNAATTQKAHLLLIERAVALFVDTGKTRLFPLEVLPDIRKLLDECAAKKLLVVQPAAWQIEPRPGLDLDVAVADMARFMGGSQRITPLGLSLPSQSIMVGSVDLAGQIQPAANRGSLVDVYLWGEGITSLGVPDEFANFRYASAAAAITAGMVAALLSAARTLGKRPSLAAMKHALSTTFRQGGVAFCPASLPDVWAALRVAMT